MVPSNPYIVFPKFTWNNANLVSGFRIFHPQEIIRQNALKAFVNFTNRADRGGFPFDITLVNPSLGDDMSFRFKLPVSAFFIRAIVLG